MTETWMKVAKVVLVLLIIAAISTGIYYSVNGTDENYCENAGREFYATTFKETPYLPNETMYNQPLLKPSKQEQSLCSQYPNYTPIQNVTRKNIKDCGLKKENEPCFTPKLGVNPRIFIPPVIVTPIADISRDYPTHEPGNFNPVEDITEQTVTADKRSMNEVNRREGYVDEVNISQDPVDKLAGLNGADAIALNSGTDYQVFSDKISDQMVSDSGITNDPRNNKMKATSTLVYTPEELNQPQMRQYVQTIQPDSAFELSWDGVPINSSLGISYAPQLPPTFRDQVLDNDGKNILYTAITPEFVRDEGLDLARQQEMPTRTAWSQKENYEAEAGTINYNKFDRFSDVYDPRLTGNGDLYRSYSDVNLGQVDYYYGDVDAYRQPVFTIRNKVDHILYRSPMKSDDEPLYIREEQQTDRTLNEIKQEVEDQTTADEVFHREDLMERLMRKRNSEMWQLRNAPVKQQNNPTSIFV